jgi:hypothetical protein
MLTIVDERTLVTPSKIAIRNYPGGVAGLPEARELFAPVLGVTPAEMIVGNNSSLALLSNTLMWAMLLASWAARPVEPEPHPVRGDGPGYDRHFTCSSGSASRCSRCR